MDLGEYENLMSDLERAVERALSAYETGHGMMAADQDTKDARAALRAFIAEGRPTDVAEILARPEIIERIRCLIRRALISGDVNDPHATHLSLLFAERLKHGTPEVTAISLVEAILGCRPDVHDTRRLDALEEVAESEYVEEVTVGQWTGHLEVPRVTTSHIESPRPTLRDMADAYLEKRGGAQFGAQSAPETTKAPESAPAN